MRSVVNSALTAYPLDHLQHEGVAGVAVEVALAGREVEGGLPGDELGDLGDGVNHLSPRPSG